ncbi:hypothetical protein [Pseudochrobactrum asaccharolyticum]|uniref:hypothetical protein n=1 Tax=Pseudochrobactrum asaccharolyticum TaxID=354351 RepID=UPI00404244FF
MTPDVKSVFLEIQSAFNVFTSKQLGGPDDERGCLLCFDDGSVLGFAASEDKICASKFGAADVLKGFYALKYNLEELPSSRVAFAENKVPIRDCDGECDWSTEVHASEFVSKKWDEWDEARGYNYSEGQVTVDISKMSIEGYRNGERSGTAMDDHIYYLIQEMNEECGGDDDHDHTVTCICQM